MKIKPGHFAMNAFLAAVLSGCGGSQPPNAAPAAGSAMPEKMAPATIPYATLYSFQGKPDGENAEARVIPFDHLLYGTTAGGGTKCARRGCGTVFKLTFDGHETVLHRFVGTPDGADPLAELLASGKELYGTTSGGGQVCAPPKSNVGGCGIVFEIGTSGTERVLHRFTGIPDGANPQGPLTELNGKFYGTTTSGGSACVRETNGCGTVYTIDATGKERTLYRFSGEPDGARPVGNLVALNGTLYGTTYDGGSSDEGVVFAITPSGRERVLYSSKGGNDMASPSGLTVLDGILYGSAFGGDSVGAIYAVTTSGDERVIHRFKGFADGENPSGKLIAVGGLLYGTTSYGGRGLGGGLVYAISPSGALRILYRFRGAPDGAVPDSGVTDVEGTLYGTTAAGGTGCHYQSCEGGYGTVFRLDRSRRGLQ